MAYPRYVTESTFELEKLCDYIENGTIDKYISDQFKKIDEYILGRFSLNLTTPHNGFIIRILVDLNIYNYKLRIEKVDSDDFWEIDSVKKAVDDILSGNCSM
jgi:hypothetical protein